MQEQEKQRRRNRERHKKRQAELREANLQAQQLRTKLAEVVASEAPESVRGTMADDVRADASILVELDALRGEWLVLQEHSSATRRAVSAALQNWQTERDRVAQRLLGREQQWDHAVANESILAKRVSFRGCGALLQ